MSSTHGFSATTAGEVSGTRLDLRTMRDSDGVAFNPNDTPTGSVPIDLLSDSLWIGKGGTQPKFMVDNVGVDVGSSTQYNGGTMIPFNAYGDARVWRCQSHPPPDTGQPQGAHGPQTAPPIPPT